MKRASGPTSLPEADVVRQAHADFVGSAHADFIGLADADFIVVGPAPPLRGGIAAHTRCLVGACERAGLRAVAASWRRLYPSALFPGRSQRDGSRRPSWCDERLDTLDPRTWLALGRELRASRATVVLQWWHPVVAPALAAAARALPRDRRNQIVAVCHNALPHEPVPGARLAAATVLGSAGKVICHSRFELAVVRGLLGADAEVEAVALPCLIDPALARGEDLPAELRALAPASRLYAAAGHLRRYKGVDVLLEAWRLARRPPDAVLALVGECYLRGKERRKVLRAIHADPSIVLVDRYVRDEELVSFLASSEALVLAHRSASQSGLMPLALALGLPCIATSAGGLREQLGESGDSGEIVAAGDPAALAAALERRFASAPHGLADPMRRADPRAFLDQWTSVLEAIRPAGRP